MSKGSKVWLQYYTLAILTHDEFFAHLNESKTTFIYGNMELRVDKTRMQTHITKGNKCCECGVSTTHFAVQASKSHKKPVTSHINAWHLVEDKDPILMTADHIIPRSKGGLDLLSNTQVMCEPCNFKKGNTYRV